jgi:negative regulator of flagellin synthesis FlgM
MDYVSLKYSGNLPLKPTTGRNADAGDGIVGSKINGIDSRPIRVSAGAAAAKVSQDSSAPPPRGGANAPAADDVHITGTARNMAALEQQIHDLPAVDASRVAIVRQRLDGGGYQVDPQRIADKLLRMERDLSNNKSSK